MSKSSILKQDLNDVIWAKIKDPNTNVNDLIKLARLMSDLLYRGSHHSLKEKQKREEARQAAIDAENKSKPTQDDISSLVRDIEAARRMGKPPIAQEK